MFSFSVLAEWWSFPISRAALLYIYIYVELQEFSTFSECTFSVGLPEEEKLVRMSQKLVYNYMQW